MASRALDLRRRLIQRDQDDLHILEQRIEDAKRARDDAVHAFELARAVMDEASKDVTTLCSRHKALQAQLNELRLSFRRDFIASLPLDVLSCVFDEVVALPQSFLTSNQFDGCHSWGHALAPFTLAAVCSRWRALALQHARLWTYISAPDEMEEQGAQLHYKRIELLLQRSKTNPLDIFICWTQSSESWETQSPSLKKILGVLSIHALRWKTLELWLPTGAGMRDQLTVFKGPLPLLERLCFYSTENSPEIDSIARFLPFAPKLREIILWGPNTLHPSSTSGLSSLRSLRLWDHFSPGQMCLFLPSVSQTLKSLALGSWGSETMAPSSAGLALPRLRSLTIDTWRSDFYSHLDKVRMPALEHLILSGNSILRQAVPFFEQISATVHTLTLAADTLRPAHVDHLKHLRGIRTLLFNDPNDNGEPHFSYQVTDEFFAAVSRDVWPKLSSVRLLAGGTFIIGGTSGTLAFISSRTQELGDTDGGLCRLEEFEVNTDSEAPVWFQAEVKRLLQTQAQKL